MRPNEYKSRRLARLARIGDQRSVIRDQRSEWHAAQVFRPTMAAHCAPHSGLTIRSQRRKLLALNEL
jgi:hypothetical protein